MARTFFALWPGSEARDALAALAAGLAGRCGGRSVPAGKIHLTLAFLGELDAAKSAAAREVAGALHGPVLDFAFDCIGSFARSRVAWVGMAMPDTRLVAFADALAGRLRAAGFPIEARPFTPHVTLVRRIERPCPTTSVAPVRWTAESVSLVESDLRTGHYAQQGSWRLGDETR